MNVLDALSNRVQAQGREILCAIIYAGSRAEARQCRERFAKTFAVSHQWAVEILERDWDRMVAFCDFPEEYWKYLLTTNVMGVRSRPYDCAPMPRSGLRRPRTRWR